MLKRSMNGKELNHSKQLSEHESFFLPSQMHLFQDGRLNVEKYFQFLTDFWKLMDDQGIQRSKRECIVMNDPKF